MAQVRRLDKDSLRGLDRESAGGFFSALWRLNASVYQLTDCVLLRRINSENFAPLYVFRKRFSIIGALLASMLLLLGEAFQTAFLALTLILSITFLHNYLEIKKLEDRQDRLDKEIRDLQFSINALTGLPDYSLSFTEILRQITRLCRESYWDRKTTYHHEVLRLWHRDWESEQPEAEYEKKRKSSLQEAVNEYPVIARLLDDLQLKHDQAIECLREKADVQSNAHTVDPVISSYENSNIFGRYLGVALNQFEESS